MLEDLLENLSMNSKPAMNHLVRNSEVKSVKNTSFDVSEAVFTCIYCNISFVEKSELQAHCQSDLHEMILMSDDGHYWNWRPPPRGFQSDVYYSLCESWRDTGCCRFGLNCVEAHGLDELIEWRERFSYRQMKLQKAKEKELYGKSYTDELLEKWTQTTSFDDIMRDSLPDVDISYSSSLNTTVSSKNSIHQWLFHISTKRPLKAVALLQDTYRSHFFIGKIENNNGILNVMNKQEWISSEQLDSPLVSDYKIHITFTTNIYGIFRQSVVFDFNGEPVVVKHLCVDVIPDLDLDKVNEIRREITLSMSERWSPSNTDIVKFTSSLVSYSANDEWEQKLLQMYKCPEKDNFCISHETMMERKFTRNNYREKMHELLFVEEMARYDLIAQYNLTAKLQITHSYIFSPNSTSASAAKYSCNGELFAFVSLGKELSEDTSEGRLILMHCMAVYFCPTPNVQQKLTVHEAFIEDKGKNVIYLRLSSKTVESLNLHPEDVLEVQIQFQLNRIPYCEWHYALDRMPSFGMIFPDTFVDPNIPWSPQRQWCISLDSRLNVKQKEAILALTTPLDVRIPPLLVIGPYGTGKTFTLAHGVKELIKDSHNRILLCTHSNSAADLYIKEYFHPWVETGNKNAHPLRIYYRKRWVNTIHTLVQKYCLIESGPSGGHIRMPTIEDIEKHKIIVVTLSTSVYLSAIGIPRGFFTHILLDEAAQAIECETITPLALVSDSTRIVFAGDHMQLGPDIFSNFVRERSLQISLLERLYDHYPANFSCKILLCENYRAHEAIIQFTSESFYDQKLLASSKQPSHDKFYPLSFFTTRGEDVQDQNSTAFYNNSEVYEVVERIIELQKNWPSTWGAMNDQSIAVVTPYSDQVFRIRSELKKRRIDNVCVERVLNVQGKQFRVILISTVRTRRTCIVYKGDSNADFGFLSNAKLLNTAITRAQSLVAVVGDPVALCSVGKCSKIWERYIQICRENGSLFGITWPQLKYHLDSIEMKKIYSLNPLAPEIIPRRYRETYMLKQAKPKIVRSYEPTKTTRPYGMPSVLPNVISDTYIKSQPVVGNMNLVSAPKPPNHIQSIISDFQPITQGQGSPAIKHCQHLGTSISCQSSQMHCPPAAHILPIAPACQPPFTIRPQSSAHFPLQLQLSMPSTNCSQTVSQSPFPINCHQAHTQHTPSSVQCSPFTSHSSLNTNGHTLKTHCSTVLSHGLPMVAHSTHLQNHPIATTASSNIGIMPQCLPYPPLPQYIGLLPVIYPLSLVRPVPYNMQMTHDFAATVKAPRVDIQHCGLPSNQQRIYNNLLVKTANEVAVTNDMKQSRSQNTLIQFMNNVHIPERHLSNKCINLLPENMTLADMILKPLQVKEQWYNHLNVTIGSEAAEKFRYILFITSHKGSGLGENSMFEASNKHPNCDSPTFSWSDSLSNQINLNKPVYMRVESNPLGHHTNSIRSNPLYQRRTSLDCHLKPEDSYLNPVKRTQVSDEMQRRINDQIFNMCINISEQDIDHLINSLRRRGILNSESLLNGEGNLSESPAYKYFS